MEKESARNIAYKLSFRKLSSDKKKELLQLQNKNNENSYVFLEKLPVYYWIVIAASLGWIAYLFYSSQNILWDNWVFWLNLSITILAVPALAFSLVKVLAFFIGKKRNGHIFTPNEFVKIKGDCIQVWNLKQVESVRIDRDVDQLEVWSGKHEERINLSDAKAESDAGFVAKMFDAWKVEATDDFVQGCDEDKLAYNPSGKMVLGFVLVIVSVLGAVGMSFAAKAANVAYDDDVTWRLADKIGTIDEFEKYTAKYPNGRHILEINERIGKKLAKIRNDYDAKSKESADSEAVDVLTEVLNQTTKNANRRIYVKVKETKELDEELIEEMKKETGFSISSYNYSVSDSSEKFRKQKILNDTKLMFRDIAKEGAIEFVLTEEPPEQRPVVEVDYVIKSTKLYFHYDLYTGGQKTTSYYPGLEFDFDFVLKSGVSPKEYKTSYTVIPKELKATFFYEDEAENNTFDRKLFSTASENFGIHLGEKFGFREQDLKKEEEPQN